MSVESSRNWSCSVTITYKDHNELVEKEYCVSTVFQTEIPRSGVTVRFKDGSSCPAKAVDRGREGQPWAMVRDPSAPYYPYKEEAFHFDVVPDDVKFVLSGSTFHCYVSQVVIDGVLQDDFCSDEALPANFTQGLDVLYVGKDAGLGYGSVGRVVCATREPHGSSQQHIRVRFDSATYDLPAELLRPASLTALGCIRLLQEDPDKANVRMDTMRSMSSTAKLPVDLVCAFLSEWIYTPTPEMLPVTHLKLLHLQMLSSKAGQNMQYAVLRGYDDGTVFLVIKGADNAFDWIGNAHFSLKSVRITSQAQQAERCCCLPRRVVPEQQQMHGKLLVHGGFWSDIENEGDEIRRILMEAHRARSLTNLILCGSSRGGASALSAAMRILVPHVGQLQVPYTSLRIVSFGSPNICSHGEGSESFKTGLEFVRKIILARAPLSKAYVFREDPVPAVFGGMTGQVITQTVEVGMSFVPFLLRLSMSSSSSSSSASDPRLSSTDGGAFTFLRDMQVLAETFEPMMERVELVPTSRAAAQTHPDAEDADVILSAEGFDAALPMSDVVFDYESHFQFNYTNSLAEQFLMDHCFDVDTKRGSSSKSSGFDVDTYSGPRSK